MVMSLSARLSMQGLEPPSFFAIKKKLEVAGDTDGRMYSCRSASLLYGLLLRYWEGVDLSFGHLSIGDEVYGTVPWSLRGKSRGLLGTEDIVKRDVFCGDV